jgi:AraC-like DNA-binding protein
MQREAGLSLVILSPVARALRTLVGNAQGAARSDPGAEPRAESLDLLGHLGLSADAARDFDTFVPGSRVGRALRDTAIHIGNRALGLALAKAMPVGSFGTFDSAVWTGGTLREAIARSSHFYALVTEGVELRVKVDGARAHVTMHAPNAARHGTVLTDLAVALNVLRAREATGNRLRLRAVTFRHRAEEAAVYDAFFETTTAFSQAADGVVFDASLLELPVRTPDPVAAMQVEARAARMLAHLQSQDPFLNGVRAAVLRGVWARDASLERVARELGVGARTLQRELRARGKSHREMVDEVRRELSIQMLAREQTSIVEVAYEVGFARLQAFYRAFARWTGTSPAHFRTTHRSAGERE